MVLIELLNSRVELVAFLTLNNELSDLGTAFDILPLNLRLSEGAPF